MSIFAVPIIAVLALFLVVLTASIFFVYLVKLKKEVVLLNVQMQSTTLLLNDLQALTNSLQEELDRVVLDNDKLTTESEQVCNQLEHRIKKLQQQGVEQQQLMTQWQENQGQDKFYNRAFKLAAKGASIDEIISECELPRAEVEMLLSVYQQRAGAQ